MLERETTKNITTVIVKVKRERYLFEVSEIKEIYIPGERIISIPLADKVIVGIIDVRGEIYTIISLRHLINKNEERSVIDEKSRILLVDYKGLNIALLVDSVIGVREFPISIFNSKSTIVETSIDYRFIESIGIIDEKVFILLDIKAILEPLLASYVEEEDLFEESFRSMIPVDESEPSRPIERRETAERRPKLKKMKIPSGKKSSEKITLSPKQEDALKEIGNIGSGNAITALSRLVKKKIDVNLTDVGIISFDKLTNQFGGIENKVCGIFSHIQKPSESTILQVFEMNRLMNLVSSLAGSKSKIDPSKIKEKKDLDEYAVSTIVEMGNILAGHYASALADLLGMKMMIDVPEFAMSEAGLLGEFLSKELNTVSKYVIIIKTNIKIVDFDLMGVFFFIPDIDTLNEIFKKLDIDVVPTQRIGTVPKPKIRENKKSPAIKLTETQRDALQEVGNIGAGNAANALAQMINKRVDINIPAVELLELDEYAEKISKANERLFVAWSNVKGKTRATVLSLFKLKDLIKIGEILVDDDKSKLTESKIKSIDDFSELYQSAISELGHILASHYSSALGDLLNLKLMTEPPDMSIDNGKQLFHILEDEIGLLKRLSLIITTSVIVKDIKITGTFLFIPELETLQGLLDALQKFYE